ncbi:MULTISPECIES: Crp/Fnr family transcriptional regulator [unclassified Aureispira]|uniref:Crp/Fnr family transcriptional regulator n=1 Tax=unclassified Aureispira TaxID=2649989 RepID=UPI000696D2C6|nr:MULTISPECIES: Crp/Fnr family transcriptional regulator [unclassified Aureispira]WMX17175.1 Crp/Fnr family transcriptional regulator [Aureispira sp. CCB-E]
MVELLLTRLGKYASLTEEEATYLAEHLVIKKYAKNEVIFSEGNIARTIYFVLEGCVRLYYNVEGIDKTAFFYTEGDFICAGESYNLEVPAIENYQAIEDSIVVLFDKSWNEKLMHAFPVFQHIALVATENELIACQKMLASFVTQSPTQRYVKLLESDGDLFLRVPQQYIASYLGVSPETLSRIKKRIANKRLLDDGQE